MKNSIRIEVLKKLKERIPEYVSGEELSEILGVSRTAIWKHIKELKDEGYIIESSSKKGYRLQEQSGLLNKYEIAYGLETEILGRDIIYFDEIDSTNTYAKKIAAEGCSEGTVVIADSQTLGRGRLGREWSSSKGKGIWMSIVLRPSILPEDVQVITLAASVAVAAAIKKVCGIGAGIKWPNDIMLDGKKVCGILTEMNSEIDRINYLILGIGINVNQGTLDFPEALRDVAVSLKEYMESGRHENNPEGPCILFDRSIIIKEILVHMEKIYKEINSVNTYRKALQDIIEEWKRYSVTLGQRVRIISKNVEFTGIASDIAWDGKLIVDCDDGATREVLSGEVSVRGLLGY